jgi:hypothetical protein
MFPKKRKRNDTEEIKKSKNRKLTIPYYACQDSLLLTEDLKYIAHAEFINNDIVVFFCGKGMVFLNIRTKKLKFFHVSNEDAFPLNTSVSVSNPYFAICSNHHNRTRISGLMLRVYEFKLTSNNITVIPKYSGKVNMNNYTRNLNIIIHKEYVIFWGVFANIGIFNFATKKLVKTPFKYNTVDYVAINEGAGQLAILNYNGFVAKLDIIDLKEPFKKLQTKILPQDIWRRQLNNRLNSWKFLFVEDVIVLMQRVRNLDDTNNFRVFNYNKYSFDITPAKIIPPKRYGIDSMLCIINPNEHIIAFASDSHIITIVDLDSG